MLTAKSGYQNDALAGAEDSVGMLSVVVVKWADQDNAKMKCDFFLKYHFTSLLILDVTATC